jgi:hypothetical protein
MRVRFGPPKIWLWITLVAAAVQGVTPDANDLASLSLPLIVGVIWEGCVEPPDSPAPSGGDDLGRETAPDDFDSWVSIRMTGNGTPGEYYAPSGLGHRRVPRSLRFPGTSPHGGALFSLQSRSHRPSKVPVPTRLDRMLILSLCRLSC